MKEKVALLQTEEEIAAQKSEEGGWTHGEWELGKRLVAEEESGEEVAVREVMLDSADGGAGKGLEASRVCLCVYLCVYVNCFVLLIVLS